MSHFCRPRRLLAALRNFSIRHSNQKKVKQLIALATAALFLLQPTLLAARGLKRFEIKEPISISRLKADVAQPVSATSSAFFVAPVVSTTLVINEIDYDQVGADAAEFLELKNVSAGTINLDNYTVELVNGSSGGAAVYDTINLPNVNLAAGDYYVICANAATVVNCDLDDGPDTDFIQNGSPDGIGLRDTGVLVDAVSYEGNTGAPYTETTGTPVATASDSNTIANLGLSRFADGTDTDNNSADVTLRCITPGTTNVSASSSCTAPVATPNLTITDVTANETNAGTTTFTFTVSLSTTTHGGVTFDIATDDGTAQDDNPATEDNDYAANSLTGQTIANGSNSYQFNVTVNGDAVVEPTETFFVNVTNVTGATVSDGQGQGTITNDDSPNLTINDVTQAEGSGGGTTAFMFNVSLSTSTHEGVTFDICSDDGTAQDGSNVGEDTDYTPICLSAQSIPNGSDFVQYTVNVNADSTVEPNEAFFVNVTNVSGATITDGQGQATITNDDITITPIHTIQGSTASGDAASPLVGQALTTTGIVTLLKTGSNSGGGTANGFFIQDPNPDADPNTSEGIFVFTSSVPTYTAGGSVAVGDELRVTGTVTEFNGLTEIGTVTNITVIDTGNSLPTAVTLDSTILSPTAAPTQPQLEKYESMRMTGTLKTVAPNNNFFEVDAVLATVARPMREPGIPASDPIPPDPTSGTPDPNIPIWDENPERLSVDTNGRAGAANNPYTSNVTFTNVGGPLDYSFGRYRLIPDAGPAASANMTAVAVPAPLATEFTIASYNIENFNNNATQRQKAADTIRNVLHYPDIIGTVEIFDLADLQALRDEINNDAVSAGDPNPMYEAYLIEQDGTSEDSDQDVGFLVKTSRVQVNAPPTQEREEETFAEPDGGNPAAILHDRPPFLLDATVDPLGANPRRVLVVVNHLRSFIDIELVAGDGPRVREKRKKQAESLADLLNDLQTANPGVPVISVGDYNAYEFNSGYDDSMSVIKGNPTADDQIVVDQSPDLVDPNLANLTENLAATERYSFIFEGTPQGLDHHVLNTAALARNTRIAIARVNSDFPENPAATYASNAATPERNSDHDPVVSYYSLGAQQAAGSVIISEFRFRGPGFIGGPPAPTLSNKIAMPGIRIPTIVGPTNQAEDEFIEIYNNSNSDITVSTTDGSTGWAVVAADGATRFIIPNGTVIPARGHFLGVNTDGYSLSNYGGSGAAAGDSVLLADGITPASGYTQDIPDGSGIALFRSANSANFTLAERLDAAGYTGVPELYREGSGFPTGGAETTGGLEYTFFRTMTRATGGIPKDTGDNTADFFLADPAGTDFDPGAGTTQRLGAPGPENLSSPINRTSEFGYALLDPTVSAEAAPNRARNSSVVANGDFGTLTIRRTFTNNTGETLSKLRFRIVEITTFPSPTGSGLADLRALDSTDEVVGATNALVLVRGTIVEQPPTQPMGGGWNASLNVPNIGGAPPEAALSKVSFDTPTTGTILLGAPLNDGASIHVQFKLGVMKTGRFFFYLNVEASVGTPVEVVN